ncbi:MAG: MFS transporter [Ruthenibacterium lactatiformans]
MRDSYIGIVMAMDNVLALFMLPLFGKLSDKTRTKIGRRMPYILGGTILALLSPSCPQHRSRTTPCCSSSAWGWCSLPWPPTAAPPWP